MSKVYPLPLAADYLDHWSVEDGIREVLQNSLDSDQPPILRWHQEAGEDTYTLTITSLGVQLSPSLLLLGNGTKDASTGDRGGFGEGFKLALLVMARVGIDVTVYNGNVVWKPVFEYSDLFDSYMLCVHEEPNEGGRDLRYVIRGLSQDQKDKVIHNTLIMQEDVQRTNTQYGNILPDYAGKVFVGGLYVCDSDLEYGYDFLPSCMPLNRDRQGVASWDLQANAQRMHFQKTDANDVAGMIFDNSKDMRQVEYRHDTPEEVVDACFLKHVQESGEVPVAASRSELQQMEADGVDNAVFYGNEAFSKLVQQSANYDNIEINRKEVLTHKQLVVNFLELEGVDISGDEAWEAYHELMEQLEE